jgi:bifunctional UDP-N-acetylglucosamine pyrophosphorylase/glucosamine-1-phosphate N-acetyltransferase
VNTGCYVFSKSIFNAIRKTGKSERGEYELTSALIMLSKKEKVDVEQASFWQPVSYPWSLLAANEVLLGRMEEMKQKISPDATIEKGAVLKGFVSVGKGTIIRSGAYIQGPCIIGKNCSVGPNCSIRPFTRIGDDCMIGNAVEIKNSILLDNVSLSHLSNCSDSIIGEGVKLGVGTVTANTRHDGATITSLINGKSVDSGLRKLGAVIGDGASTGVNTSIYPGSKIWPNKATNPGDIVTEDIL